AGAAFVPIDPALPAARRRFLSEDAGARIVLDRATASAAGAFGPPLPIDEKALAYVIYTSGSTGAPKGVEVTHRGIVNLLDAQIAAFRIDPASRVLWMLSPSFDASVSDIGIALLAGATLCVGPRAAANDLLSTIAARRA